MHNSTGENDDAYEVIGEPNWQVLENHQSESDEIIVKIVGFQKVTLRVILYNFVCILFIGIPYLLVCYYPHYNAIKYKKCSLRTAKYICVTDNEGAYLIEHISEMDLNLSNHKDGKVRYFIYQHTRYIWIKDQGAFVNVQSLNEKLSIGFLMESISGINKRQQNELLKLYGPNSVEVEVKSYWTIFKSEVFNPFYLFQVFSIILWSLDEYYQYAACVFILSVGSCIMSLYTTKKMSIMLHKMAGSMSAMAVSVVRPGRAQCVVAGSRLVPGDILVLPPTGCVMPCDALLLTGSCIVNESMLTGESVPVMKSPPNPSLELFSTENHKRHTLFAGTQVIQTRFYDNNQVLAKVVRTGFYTAKGELIKSILFPKPFGFQFYKDSVKFILFLFSIAAMGMAYCIWLYVERGSSWDTIVLRTLDIITIVVPPALPAAMTAGTVSSQRRLRAHRIYCLSPPRINVCGKLQLICFDKTGTLTEDGLELHAVLPAREGGDFGHCVREARALCSSGPLLQALACCHSLTSVDGALTGDPLDLHMFHFTSWVLEEPGPENARFDTLSPPVVKPASTNEAALQDLDEIDPLTMEIPYEIGLLRRFHFSSTQQSMGVIVRVLGQQQMAYFVKGAPEKIAGMCQPDSLPVNFSKVLNEYTSNGFRVIGLAYKQLRMKWVDAQRVKRDQLECDMLFLGLLVMQNSLKPETADVISDLHDAKIRQIMVTGDNIMTAMSVGRVCGMVPPHKKLLLVTVGSQTINDQRPSLCFEVIGEGEVPKFELRNADDSYALAVEGRTWIALRHHYPELMKYVLDKGTIFGRFGPDQKTQLVVALQEGDLTVGMCGDGANDCGALKAAHIGVSLSQADASVAAPFTSHEQNIRCVKLLTLEGRCALSTSFAIFKYMALYSLIQFFSILILYHFYSILGNYQFLYIDLVLTTLLALSLGRAGPAPSLSPHAPPHSLVALSTTGPLTLQVLLVLLAQLLALQLLTAQPWYVSVVGGPNIEVVECWENTVIFIVSCYQYLILACVYSKGRPFRQRFCSNYYMVVTLITQCVLVTGILLCPWDSMAKLMEVVAAPDQMDFRLYMLVVPVLHLMLAVAIEATAAEGSSFRRLFFGTKDSSKSISASPNHVC